MGGFRPLAGISGLGTLGDYGCPSMNTWSFRPLAGISGLGTGLRAEGYAPRPECFRPLAGISGLGTGVQCGHRFVGDKFPSPCGD